ncbi:universal stress protein A-like protein [Lycium ferocissimum]|uniref:universal stress protein A-like protein n=1 Tax=Lycium ferocissimum TaxID=112874 RepID=UPI00281498FD|nr:universal stress protein A-like protein [Lycium ferocissimum]
MAEKQVMIFALDDSDHSYYALEWTLDHFFPSPSTSNFKLIIVHAKPNPTSVIALAGPGTTDMFTLVETDIKKAAQKTIDKSKELCKTKGVANVVCEILEGDARNVICEAVERHHASILAMGSHGYGAFKRAVLGSVSDYCSHHAHCSVMIVKKPKPKN